MADRRERTWYLRRLDLLQGLSEPEIERLAEVLGSRDFRAGDLIVGPEAAAERVYIVLEGTVRLFHRGPDGRELTADLVGRGRLFGVSALFGPEPDGLLAEAATPAVVCVTRAEAFARLIAEHPPIMLKLAAQLGARLLQVERQLDRLASADARTRLAAALHHLAEQDGEPRPDGGRRIRVRPTHADLARQIGASRETVTRLLGSLEDDGYIRRDGRRIVVRDLHQLAQDFDLVAESP